MNIRSRLNYVRHGTAVLLKILRYILFMPSEYREGIHTVFKLLGKRGNHVAGLLRYIRILWQMWT